MFPFTALLGASANALVSTSIPSAVISNQKDLLTAVMNEFYGTFNQTSNCWITRRPNATYCMNPYKVDSIGAAGARKLFIAIAGKTLGEDGTPNEYHAASGILGLIVLGKGRTTALGLVAQNNLFEEIGSFGKVPPKSRHQSP